MIRPLERCVFSSIASGFCFSSFRRIYRRLSVAIVGKQLWQVATGSSRRLTIATEATSTRSWSKSRRNATVVIYTVAAVIGVAGMSYAAVPLYRLFCQVRHMHIRYWQLVLYVKDGCFQSSGYGGTVNSETSAEKMEYMRPVEDRVLTIRCASWTIN